MSKQNSNQMWGGRFEEKPSDIMEQINASIDVDQRMWRQDIRGSKAHAQMLGKQGIITQEDEAAIQQGLDQVAEEIAAGKLEFSMEVLPETTSFFLTQPLILVFSSYRQ